jgi:hypothetical protein
LISLTDLLLSFLKNWTRRGRSSVFMLDIPLFATLLVTDFVFISAYRHSKVFVRPANLRYSLTLSFISTCSGIDCILFICLSYISLLLITFYFLYLNFFFLI